jgi:hypothetical protein
LPDSGYDSWANGQADHGPGHKHENRIRRDFFALTLFDGTHRRSSVSLSQLTALRKAKPVRKPNTATPARAVKNFHAFAKPFAGLVHHCIQVNLFIMVVALIHFLALRRVTNTEKAKQHLCHPSVRSRVRHDANRANRKESLPFIIFSYLLASAAIEFLPPACYHSCDPGV